METKNKRNGILIGNIIDRMKLSIDMWRLRDASLDITINGRDAEDLLDYLERVHDELAASRQLLTDCGMHRYGSHSDEQITQWEAMEAKNETMIYSLVRMRDEDIACKKTYPQSKVAG